MKKCWKILLDRTQLYHETYPFLVSNEYLFLERILVGKDCFSLPPPLFRLESLIQAFLLSKGIASACSVVRTEYPSISRHISRTIRAIRSVEMRITTSLGWLLSSRWLIVSELLVGINSYRPLLKPYRLAIIGCSMRLSRDGADYGNFRLQCRIQARSVPKWRRSGRESRALIAQRDVARRCSRESHLCSAR